MRKAFTKNELHFQTQFFTHKFLRRNYNNSAFSCFYTSRSFLCDMHTHDRREETFYD